MIERAEIDSKATEFDINVSDVQRDYMFSWLLNGIYRYSDLGRDLVLKGGNCFRKAYFKDTRFSRDLDFAAKSRLDEEHVGRSILHILDYIEENTGVEFNRDDNRIGKKKRVDPSKDVLEARLYFRDFYGRQGKMVISVRLDITQDDRIILPIQQRQIIHPYSDQEQLTSPIQCLKVEELLAAKLKCLLQRRHSPDFFDYAAWLLFNNHLEVNKREIARAFFQMTVFQRSPEAARDMLINLPFAIIRGLWGRFIVCPQNCRIIFDEAVDAFKASMYEVFGQAPAGRAALAFFPAELRNPIMEAANNSTLLDLEYGGVVRQVEPYSISYKRRQDGLAREYFYAYDLTGGRTSGPGIKSFVADKVVGIRNTETTFEPRFEVELKKAGELPGKTYFGRPFSPGRSRGSGTRAIARSARTRVSRRSNIYGMTYTIECPVCGKKFKRSKLDTKLNKHKDRYGNYCYGKIGFIVG